MPASPQPGHLILIVGLPGGGKGVLLEHLRATFPQVHFAVSCTTRAQRPGEQDGQNYHFVSEEEFRARVADGKFLEWIEQDGGNLYGTLKADILDPIKAGEVVIREVEVRGVEAIRALVPKENLTVIFIDADPWPVLEKRIQERAPISAEELAKRKERYERERLFVSEADVVVQNYDGKLEEAKRQLTVAVAEVLASVVGKRTGE